MAQQLGHLLLLRKTWVQFPVLTWQFVTIKNSSSVRSDTFRLLKEPSMHMEYKNAYRYHSYT